MLPVAHDDFRHFFGLRVDEYFPLRHALIEYA